MSRLRSWGNRKQQRCHAAAASSSPARPTTQTTECEGGGDRARKLAAKKKDAPAPVLQMPVRRAKKPKLTRAQPGERDRTIVRLGGSQEGSGAFVRFLELGGRDRHSVHVPVTLQAHSCCSPIRPVLVLVVAGALFAQEPTPSSRREALERASRELGATPVPAVQPSGALGTQSGPLRLLDVSLNILAAAGASTERDAVLSDLQGGAHDPRKRGFTLQQTELSLSGAVDPWFKGEAHLIASLDPDEGETIVELEEAFLTTQQLPAGLQLKAGTYFTEFGRINPLHPHAWDWQDQPIINTRLFGGDGMRGPGARLAWLLPTDTFAEVFLGIQNANGETMTSFLANDEVYADRGIGGRFFEEREVRSGGDLVYPLRAMTSFDPSDTHSIGLGASAVYGPNATGGDGETLIYGADFVWRWKPVANDKGYPFFKLQGEFMARAFDAVEQTDDADPLNPVTLPGETLDDYGGYLQGLYGFAAGWAAGVRVDWASGSGESYDASNQTFGRDSDPYRTDRLRVSPLVVWRPSEFSRFRLQYNYDDSDHLDDPAHSVWLGFEVLIGTHPPHSY